MSARHAPHVHDGPPVPSGVRGRRAVVAAVVLIALATCAGLVLLRPTGEVVNPRADERELRVKGTVVAATATPCVQTLPGAEFREDGEEEFAGSARQARCVDLQVRLEEGADAGRTFTTTTEVAEGRSAKGDRVVLLTNRDRSIPFEARYQITDVQRGRPLLVLGVLFALVVVGLGRLRGLLALAGLAGSLVVLVGWLVPALLDGRPPLLTATVGATAVMLFVVYLAHGFSMRTSTAVLGTAASLLLTLGLAAAFTRLAALSGLTSEEAAFVHATFAGVDARGLLLAGIVVGALGILDDVTVTQVSAVWELRRANPLLPPREVYAAALRVGRDHIASLVNTLLLAYAGASLPLLVVFSTSGAGLVGSLTNGVLAEEVVRTLVGSIGLVAAVPVTTALAAWTAVPAPAEGQPAAVAGRAPDQAPPVVPPTGFEPA